MVEALPFTLIIPAHNEEAVIGRCLRAVQKDAPADHAMEIIVAANGCHDQTVAMAQMAAPSAKVLDLPVGSKTAAINAANSIASHFPRIYLDADVECSYAALSAVAEALRQPNVMAAAPSIRLKLDGCSRAMKAYYRAWLTQPYAKAGKGGAGCYGLSEAGLGQISEFPPIIADDLWIQTRFPDAQRRCIGEDQSGKEVFSVVHPPRTALEQIKVEARRWIGTAEVKKRYPTPYVKNSEQQGSLAILRSGASPGDLTIYLAIKLSARLLAKWRMIRGRSTIWSRDLSSRTGTKADD
ncbi:MAG: glycosyltransferase [Erythrobacter sp.]